MKPHIRFDEDIFDMTGGTAPDTRMSDEQIEDINTYVNEEECWCEDVKGECMPCQTKLLVTQLRERAEEAERMLDVAGWNLSQEIAQLELDLAESDKQLAEARETIKLAGAQYMGCGGNLTDREALNATRSVLSDYLARLQTTQSSSMTSTGKQTPPGMQSERSGSAYDLTKGDTDDN